MIKINTDLGNTWQNRVKISDIWNLGDKLNIYTM